MKLSFLQPQRKNRKNLFSMNVYSWKTGFQFFSSDLASKFQRFSIRKARCSKGYTCAFLQSKRRNFLQPQRKNRKNLFSMSIIKLIEIYQWLISPCLGSCCRFYPSCSAYAIDAMRHYGFWYSIFLILRRLLKCHPGSPGGVDPVP